MLRRWAVERSIPAEQRQLIGFATLGLSGAIVALGLLSSRVGGLSILEAAEMTGISSRALLRSWLLLWSTIRFSVVEAGVALRERRQAATEVARQPPSARSGTRPPGNGST